MKKGIVSDLSLNRQWIPNLVPSISPKAIPIRVLSYNVLAPGNCGFTFHWYSEPEHVLWPKRLPRLKQYFCFYCVERLNILMLI